MVFHFEDMMVKEKFGDLITVEGWKAWEIKDPLPPSPRPVDGQQASLAMTAEQVGKTTAAVCDEHKHTVYSRIHMHALTQPHITTCIYIHVCTLMYSTTHAHDMHTYAYTHMQTNMHTHLSTQWPRCHTYSHMNTSMYTHAQPQHTPIHMHVHIHIHVSIPHTIYNHTHTHTCKHSYAHTCVYM